MYLKIKFCFYTYTLLLMYFTATILYYTLIAGNPPTGGILRSTYIHTYKSPPKRHMQKRPPTTIQKHFKMCVCVCVCVCACVCVHRYTTPPQKDTYRSALVGRVCRQNSSKSLECALYRMCSL